MVMVAPLIAVTVAQKASVVVSPALSGVPAKLGVPDTGVSASARFVASAILVASAPARFVASATGAVPTGAGGAPACPNFVASAALGGAPAAACFVASAPFASDAAPARFVASAFAASQGTAGRRASVVGPAPCPP